MRLEKCSVHGVSASIPAVIVHCDNPRGTALVLPGGGGGWSTPAVYYPMLAVVDAGFDAVGLESVYTELPEVDELVGDSRAALRFAQTTAAIAQTVLVGKSLGTLAIAELLLSRDVSLDAPTIWLTPLLDQGRVVAALAALLRPALIVIGTRDPAYDRDYLDLLRTREHAVVEIADADHGFYTGNATDSAAVPTVLVDAVAEYLR